MKNIDMELNGTTLTLNIDLSEMGELSGKGTTHRVAYTQFFEKLDDLLPPGFSMQMVLLRSVKTEPLGEKKKPAKKEKEAEKTTAKKSSKAVEKKSAKKSTRSAKPAATTADDEEDGEVAMPIKRRRAA